MRWLLVRWVAGWMPVCSLMVLLWVALMFGFGVDHGQVRVRPSGSPIPIVFVVLVAMQLAGLLANAIRNPERGLQDRVAGTWLVPR